MRIIFTGGGTAGHINPAVAIAEEMKKKGRDDVFLFVGREGGAENKIITDCGFALKTIKIRGLERKITYKNIENIFLMLKSLKNARKIVAEFKPDVIVGTGGYVCWPMMTVGKSMNIPTVIHESNVTPGLVTKLCASKCTTVLLNHNRTKEYLSPKCNCKVVGNPLRGGFTELTKEEARAMLGVGSNQVLILSFGGSGGSRRLNEVITACMKEYSVKESRVKHIHSTGRAYYEEFGSDEFDLDHNGCKTMPYIENMPIYMRAADIVISRCGAVTLSEIAVAGVASILIPSPNVTDNHQLKNAVLFSQKNAALVIEEKDLSAEQLKQKVKELVNDRQKRRNMQKCIELFAKKNAAALAANEIYRTFDSFQG